MRSNAILSCLFILPALALDIKARPWADARRLARQTVDKLTLEEKVNILSGQGLFANRCSGNTIAAGSIPSLCFNDGPAGVRGTDKVSAFPASINLAATWDRSLMHQQGLAIGQEARKKGINVLLGPDINLVRSPAAGRMWETFGPDPFLSSEASVKWVNGLQSTGVSACAKHIVGEEQERGRLSYDVIIDDRTLHEAYLLPFERVITDANVGCIMCGYNKVNGTYACQNAALIGKSSFIRRSGFQGFILSDWGATHPSTKKTVQSGMAVEMPGGNVLIGGGIYGENLVAAVRSGSVKESDVDGLVMDVLGTYFRLRQDQGFPATNYNTMTSGSITVNETQPNNGNQHVNTRTSEHTALIREVGAASHVLLKNEDAILPLKCKRNSFKVAIIGSDARKGNVSCVDNQCNDGTVALGWGAGSANLSYLVWPAKAFQEYSAVACPQLELVQSLTDDLDDAKKAAGQADVAIVFVNVDSGEQILNPANDYTAVEIGNVQGVRSDRTNLTLWHNGENLIKKVAAVNCHTIVVVHSPGPVLVESWIDDVQALIHAGMPGEQSGNALVNVIFGAVNPSGKLPFTISKQGRDYPARITTDLKAVNNTVVYSEGLLLDYRHFDAYKITPRFDFGFGLSYTTFAYSNLHITPSRLPKKPDCDDEAPETPTDGIFRVAFTVKNTGKRFGKEVSQLYLSFRAPHSSSANPEPPKQLKGFEITSIDAGCEEKVEILVKRRDLSYWDVASQKFQYICDPQKKQHYSRTAAWHSNACKVQVMVGSSSRQIHLKQTIQLED